MTNPNEIPWPVTNMASPIHPWHPVAMVPESQARALWEGAKMILEHVGRLPNTVEWEIILKLNEATELLRKGIGE